MIIGVPKEIKPQEYRVGLVPSSVQDIVSAGGTVLVETTSGLGIGIDDDAYRTAGARIVDSAEEIYANANLIIKVKEPQPIECRYLRAGQTLFTFLHLAPDPEQTRLLVESGVTAIAYETVTQPGGGLPLLIPMSQVAGRMSIQAGASCLEIARGGSGVLLGGVPGVAPANVVIIGGGVVGTNAACIAIGMGARVTLLDSSLNRLRELDFEFGSRLTTLYATQQCLEQQVMDADLVIGAVLVPGATAPRLVSCSMLKTMRPGSVLVDVAIDQGGCFETSHATTHQEPTYVIDNVVHYAVANMPGAVPKTSTLALNNATLPFILSMVRQGVIPALQQDPHLLNGLNIYKGHVTCEAVANSLGYSYVSASDLL